MATTLYSTSLMTAAESWRAIRTIRSEPQGSLEQTLTNDQARRREFHMSLEQAQQQFAAAERIGYESRPLNLFYGLSQAGRAIAAGSSALSRGTGEQWQASGHGVKFDIGIQAGVFATPIRLEGGSRDLFSRVSIAIGSPLDFDAIEFGAALNQLLDYAMMFPDSDGFNRPITDAQIYNFRNMTFPLDLEVRVPGLTRGRETSADEVRALLSPYPALTPLSLALDDEGNVRWSNNEGRCFVIVEGIDQLQPRAQGSIFYPKGTDYYRRTAVILPRAGEGQSPLRPLMAWWVVLYALSMLARYAPSKWTAALSLTESRIASRVEFVLDSAVDAVPELLFDELLRLNEA